MMTIEGCTIGGGAPCRTIAEISNNHNGSLDIAMELIAAAHEAGADFVKFQAYTADELCALRGDGPAPDPWGAQGMTMRQLYERAATPASWFPALFGEARRIGIVPFASVFGAASMQVLEAVDCPAYKVAKFERRQYAIAGLVARTGKPCLVSVPSRANHDHVLRRIPSLGVLYCPGGYPCTVEEVALPREFRGDRLLGLSSHCLDPALPIAAVARGAALLEYHFQLRDHPSDLEAAVSLNEIQFRNMVLDVRTVEAMTRHGSTPLEAQS